MHSIVATVFYVLFTIVFLVGVFIYARRKMPSSTQEQEVVSRSESKPKDVVETTPVTPKKKSMDTIPDMPICPDRNARKEEPYSNAPENAYEIIPEDLSHQATATQERRMQDREQLRACLKGTVEPPVLASEATKFYFFNYPYHEGDCKVQEVPKNILMADDNASWSDVMHFSNNDVQKLASELAE